MLSIKNLFFTSLLFSKIIFTDNSEQQINISAEQIIALDQKITDLEQEYLNIVNADIPSNNTLQKLLILKHKTESLLLSNSSLFTKVSLVISAFAIYACIDQFGKAEKEMEEILKKNHFHYKRYEELLCLARIYLGVAIVAGICTCCSIYTLFNAYNQNQRLHLLIEHINALEKLLLRQNSNLK